MTEDGRRRAGVIGIALPVLALVVIAVIGTLFILPSLRPPELHGVMLQSPAPAGDFTLTSMINRKVSLSQFRGKLVLLYFGYTSCPDVCPTSMYEMKRAMAALGRQADQVQVLMVTVDPDRDTPERTGQYASNFDPRFIGLSGSEDEIAAAATPFGIYYQKHEGTVETGYAVDHTATISVIDRQGYVRLILPFGVKGEEIASDLRYLLSR